MGRAAPGGGQGLGTASAKIVIDSTDLARIQVQSQQVGQTVARNLGQIDGAAKRAQSGFTNLTASATGLAGALGLATGAAAAVQFGRMALQADTMATAYRRQSVAALSLAGSQENLNDLLSTYMRVTGGVVDRAQALADVTRLQAVGFADSAEELERFTVAARGISVAMGIRQDYVISQLQLAIANQSTMRLDQIGLGVSEVKNRIDELKAANKGMTEEMAYQEAVLGIAIAKYGQLATSLEAQATGAEKAARAWKDLQLQFGESAGPAISGVMDALSKELDRMAQQFRDLSRDVQFLKNQLSDDGWTMPAWLKAGLGLVGIQPISDNPQPTTSLEERYLRGQIRSRENTLSHLNRGLNSLDSDPQTSRADIERQRQLIAQVNAELTQFSRQLSSLNARELVASGKLTGLSAGLDISQLGRAVPTAAAGYTDDQKSLMEAWANDVSDIEREAAAARLDATRQYEQQRADVIADYGRTIVREEQDFARNRARAIADYNQQVAEAQRDAAEREAEAQRSYARQVARLQEDSAERAADWQAEYNERVADLRADGNDRLQELEADYQRDRERAAEDHRDRLLDAAGRLDAVAVREAQRSYARQQETAAENYEEQRKEIQDALQEQLADALEAQRERLADAREADAERLADMREAFDEQQAAAREADERRLEEMKADFEQRLAREDEDRAIMAQRRAEDHAVQLAEMAQAQADRMAKINEQEAKELRSLEEAFLEQLEEQGLYNAQWLKLQELRQEQSLKMFDEFWSQMQQRFAVQGPMTQAQYLTDFAGGTAPAASFPTSFSQAAGRSYTVGPIAVYGAPGMDEEALARAVRSEVTELFRELE